MMMMMMCLFLGANHEKNGSNQNFFLVFRMVRTKNRRNLVRRNLGRTKFVELKESRISP